MLRNDRKFSGTKQHEFITLQCWKSAVWSDSQLKIKVLAILHSFLEALGGEFIFLPFPVSKSHLHSLARFLHLQRQQLWSSLCHIKLLQNNPSSAFFCNLNPPLPYNWQHIHRFWGLGCRYLWGPIIMRLLNTYLFFFWCLQPCSQATLHSIGGSSPVPFSCSCGFYICLWLPGLCWLWIIM